MAIIYCRGDLFLSKAHTLAHGCNCDGVMGAGIAKEFKRRFPEMYNQYRERCLNKTFIPGDYWLCKNTSPWWVLNLATQYSTKGADSELLTKSFQALEASYQQEGIQSVAMPLIATGLGGLTSIEVYGIMSEIFIDSSLPIFVYHVYEKDMSSSEEENYFYNLNREGGEEENV